MATEKPILVESKKAGEELSERRYRLVRITSESTLVLAASGSRAFALLDTPKTGEYGTIGMAGIVKVELAGAVEAGELVVPNNEGKGVAASGKAQPVVGIALEKGEAGQLISVFANTSGATA